MELLRRAWLVAIAAVAIVGTLCALAMRYELLTPGGTLSQTTYNDAFTVHGVTMVAAVTGAIITIPALVLRPTRPTLYFGAAALIAWATATLLLVGAAFAPSDWVGGATSLRAPVIVLALAAFLAAVQTATTLPRFSIPSITAITALVILAIPLVQGDLPTREYLLAACTLSAYSSRSAWPCLAAAWLVTILFHAVHVSFLPDTVARVAPLPALGGAMLVAVLAAAHRKPPWVLLLTLGSIATSAGFLVLGLRGMPARYWQYDPSFQPLQILVGVSFALTIAAGVRVLR